MSKPHDHKQLIINKDYEVKEGKAKGIRGRLVAYDYFKNEAQIEVDDKLLITTVSENLDLV